MSRRTWIALGAFAGLVALAAVAYDALVESDEERLEELIEDCTGTMSEARIRDGRARWIDLSRQPFEISGFGEARAYGEGDEDALDERQSEAVRALNGASLRALSSSVSVEGDRGIVTLRILSDRTGMMQVEWTLEKHGDDWLVARLSIRR